MKLVVGLGNPGKQYEKTRHNVGFLVIDNFVIDNNIGNFVYQDKSSGEFFCNSDKFSDKILFLKPMTFMNKSGDSVAKIVNFYKIKPSDILVLHDEIDLPVGSIKLKIGGGHAGHNGLRSIIASIGSPDFVRLRIGVGRPLLKEEVVDYVLGNFKKEEISIIKDKEEEITKFILDFIS